MTIIIIYIISTENAVNVLTKVTMLDILSQLLLFPSRVEMNKIEEELVLRERERESKKYVCVCLFTHKYFFSLNAFV